MESLKYQWIDKVMARKQMIEDMLKKGKYKGKKLNKKDIEVLEFKVNMCQQKYYDLMEI